MYRWRALVIVAGVIVLCWAAVMWWPMQALETRTQQHHEQLTEDTQALADAYNGLADQNAVRSAEIALLQKEIAALRAELSALRRRR